MNPTTMHPAPPLPQDLTGLLRRMRLPYLRAAAPEVLATAKAQRWDPAEVLQVLLTEEIRGRDEATKTMRRKAAGLPAGKTFGSWRAMSTEPMYTTHSSPSNAAAVADATPCCPAPVSATTRFFPIRLTSKACPNALLILCAPVCARSSRFK